MKIVTFIPATLLLAATLTAGNEPSSAIAANPAFEKLKSLAGS